MQKLKRRIITLAILLAVLLGIFFEMTRFAPKRVSLRFETVVSDTLPTSFNNASIALFSDVYGNIDNLRKGLAHMRDYNADFVIFTGNLLGEDTSEEHIKTIQEVLSDIPDNLGKYAVLGDKDTELTQQILHQAGFRIIDGSRISVHNNAKDTIELVGIAKDGVYNATESEHFEIAISHNPDVIDSLQNSNIDVMLAGKSLLGQVRLPIIGPVLPSPKHNRKHERINKTELIQSAGIGQPDSQIRFLTNPDVVIITLKTP